ncbi:MAG: hypothetical protein NVS2B9_05970 [Myxococcales bacterium]
MDHPPLTLGTAGHIDHGKTALVRALTGRETDRLPQERARGISIELGYAPLDLPGGRRLSVVDVPGHERFVRTMVAGATGIDLFLLCVAADDGVMPQTIEHLAVLRQLGIDRGVTAVTKSDIADPELVAEELAELLPGVPVVPVSAVTGSGIGELLGLLAEVASAVPGRAGSGGQVRLHVDRSFTLRGIGTVVTGTLWSGAVGLGDSLRVLPGGRDVRVRSVQVHDQAVERAAAGQRVALNLAGVGWREIGRGDVLVAANAGIEPSHLLDVAATLEHGVAPLPRGVRVQVHHGTREVPARAFGLEGERLRSGYAQLRLEAPLVAATGDRLIIRRIAPPDTIAGAVVIDPRPRKHGPGTQVRERLAMLERGEQPDPAPRPAERAPAPPVQPQLDDAAMMLLALLRSDGSMPRSDRDLAMAAGLSDRDARDRLLGLERAGMAIRVAQGQHFEPGALDEVETQVIALCRRDGAATIATLRDQLGTSRRYAQALLEHFDRARLTRRDGDVHVLRRKS